MGARWDSGFESGVVVVVGMYDVYEHIHLGTHQNCDNYHHIYHHNWHDELVN